MVKIKVYTSKDRCDLGTVEIDVRYSAQYLVHFRCPVSDYYLLLVLLLGICLWASYSLWVSSTSLLK